MTCADYRLEGAIQMLLGISQQAAGPFPRRVCLSARLLITGVMRALPRSFAFLNGRLYEHYRFRVRVHKVGFRDRSATLPNM
jgi:hypothetical protein